VGIGASLILVAVGAIMRWAVRVHVSWVSVHMVGLILLIVGVAGVLLSLHSGRPGAVRPPGTPSGRRLSSGTRSRPRPTVQDTTEKTMTIRRKAVAIALGLLGFFPAAARAGTAASPPPNT